MFYQTLHFVLLYLQYECFQENGEATKAGPTFGILQIILRLMQNCDKEQMCLFYILTESEMK